MDEPGPRQQTAVWHDFDVEGFFDDSEYGLTYVEASPSDELIAELESELGFRLPDSYVEFCRRHNGGIPKLSCFPTDQPSGWAEDHAAINGILSIGRGQHSLGGDHGSKFWQEEWGYPSFGICFADTPTGGHTMFMFDYRECGPQGEPQVILVDQECDYRIGVMAPTFEQFIRGLVDESEFEEE
ncbi:MAG: SMI1/KNR4 family protein [Propionicimonas sp.]